MSTLGSQLGPQCYEPIQSYYSCLRPYQAGNYRVSFDPRSQAASSRVSTWEGDHLGTPDAAVILFCHCHWLVPDDDQFAFFWSFEDPQLDQ
jgi:hypothetical protein